MSNTIAKVAAAVVSPAVTLAEFLESSAPGTCQLIPKIGSWLCDAAGREFLQIKPPEIRLHCPSTECGEFRIYHCTLGDLNVVKGKSTFFSLHYQCGHCKDNYKTYAVVIAPADKSDESATVLKIGEAPSFDSHAPSRAISLIGLDRELFLQGHRTENVGLGIDAYMYYRRIVDNQFARIVQKIGKVAAHLGANPEEVALFERAAKEDQFSKAVELVKGAIPECLKINGENPLTLLNSTFNEGVHQRTDAECLEIAADVRVVLTELMDRIAQVLKNQAELTAAVARLQGRAAKKAMAKRAGAG